MGSWTFPLDVALAGAGLIADHVRGRRKPFIVNHLVTVRCNMRCPFCYVSGPEQQEFNRAAYPASQEMSTEEVRAFYRQLVAGGYKIAIVLGGEPLLRTDLDSMLEVLKGHLLVTVFTNGFLLEQRAELLRSASTVFISLDAPDDRHDELRATGGAFRRVMAGVEAMRSKLPQVRLALNMTVTRANADRVPEMLTLARRMRLPIGFQPPSYKGQFAVDGRPHVRSEQEAAEQALVAGAFRRVKAAARQGQQIIGTAAFFDLVIEDRQTYPCHYPRYVLGPVLPNGDVIACTTSRPLGNLRREALADITASASFERNAQDGLSCSHGCRDWGIHDLSSVFNREFTVRDGRRYFRTFVASRPGAAAPV